MNDQRRGNVEWAHTRLRESRAENRVEGHVDHILNDLWDRAFDAGHANFDKDRGAALTAMTRARAADRAKIKAIEKRLIVGIKAVESASICGIECVELRAILALANTEGEHDD